MILLHFVLSLHRAWSVHQGSQFRVEAASEEEEWVKREEDEGDLPGKGPRICLAGLGVAFIWGCGIVLVLCVALGNTSFGGTWFKSEAYNR